MIRRRHLLPAFAVLVALLLGLAGPLGYAGLLGLPPKATGAAALAVFSIGFWATGALPEQITTLAFFLLAMLFAVAPASVVFSGFESGAFWLIFGGLVIGLAIVRSGLAQRIAENLVRRFPPTYRGIIGGVVAISVLLGFLMPSSMGRVVLMMPIVLAMADRFGFEEGSKGRLGLVLAAAFGCHVPTFAILPANVPNMVLAGAAETLYHYSPIYGEYLLLHFPVLGLLKSVLIVGLIVWLVPDRPRPLPAADRVAVAVPLTAEQRRLAVVLVVALGLWLTDFIHHISPAWVSLGAALVCVLPAMKLIPLSALNEKINYGSLFYVAGIMGLGAIVAHSGLGDALAHAMMSVLPLAHGATAGNFASLSGTATLLGLATTLPGVPAVLVPLAGELAKASGLSLAAVLMTQVLGFSTILLPYESAPLVVGMQLGGQSVSAAVKLTVALAVLTVLLLFPLDYLWWRLLGWL